jgi:hypothetical protein
MHGRIDLLTWGGGEHAFALRIGELRALQQKCDAGPERVLRRIASGDWQVDDLLTVIRLGLKGGGLGESEASRLVEAAVLTTSLIDLKVTAHLVLSAALVGVKDDPVGEPQAPETPGPGDGPSAASTAPGP